MRIRIAATGLVTVGLLAAMATAGVAGATTAVAGVSATPASCAQQHLALLDAEDALSGVEAAPEVKAAHDALVEAAAAAGVNKPSQKMTPQQLGAHAAEADSAAAKALEAYNAAGTRYLQTREAALSKVTPQHQSSRAALRQCLKVDSA